MPVCWYIVGSDKVWKPIDIMRIHTRIKITAFAIDDHKQQQLLDLTSVQHA